MTYRNAKAKFAAVSATLCAIDGTRRLATLSLAVLAALTMSLTQTGCASSGISDDDSEMADGSSASEISADDKEPSLAANDKEDGASEIASESASIGLDDPGPTALDAGEDSKLTQEIAKEELTDTGSFDLDADESQPPAAPKAQPVVAAPAPDLAPGSEPAPASAAAPAASVGTGEQVTLTNLKYVSRKGGGTVVIETSAPATFHTREVASQNQTIVEIENATLPAKFKRPYTTKDFNQAIASMNAYQEAKKKKNKLEPLRSPPIIQN